MFPRSGRVDAQLVDGHRSHDKRQDHDTDSPAQHRRDAVEESPAVVEPHQHDREDDQRRKQHDGVVPRLDALRAVLGEAGRADREVERDPPEEGQQHEAAPAEEGEHGAGCDQRPHGEGCMERDRLGGVGKSIPGRLALSLEHRPEPVAGGVDEPEPPLQLTR